MAQFSGVVTQEICELRFAFAGKLEKVQKHTGDPVKKGEIIASLDRKILQTELDKQLADYEKVRADFELFIEKNGKEDNSETEKLQRKIKQATLDISVKDVELSKYKLDQADLISPVDGVVIDIDGLVSGLYVTPANSPIRVSNGSTTNFTCNVSQDSIQQFLSPRRVMVKILGRDIGGMTKQPTWGKDGMFPILVHLDEQSGLIAGMTGEAFLV